MTVGALPATAVSAIAELVRARAGLVFSTSRQGDVESAIRKIMVKAGATDVAQCARLLHEQTPLLDDLIAELTIGETYFFRGAGHFAGIRDTIVPELRRLRGPEHVLRVWSAGCASGEEAYSLAILFEEMGLAGRASILATDISPAALARARKAEYGAWSLRGAAAQRLVGTYLLPVGDRFQLAAHIRRRVMFARLNLAQDSYPTFATNTWGMDLVLCCNVLIYFGADTVRAVARRLHDSLADGGFLIVGASDPPLAEHAPFEAVVTAAGVIYRKPAATNGWQATVAVPSLAVAQRVPDDDVVSATPARPATAMPSAAASTDPVAEARGALARGDNARVVELTLALPENVAAVALGLRALANLGDLATATAAAAVAMARHPTSAEIGFLHAILLMNLGDYPEAERILRRVLYLDRSLVVGHFALAATLNQLGKPQEASRAYRNARDLAARHPADDIVPFSDGERAGQLVKAAAAQVALFKTTTRPVA